MNPNWNKNHLNGLLDYTYANNFVESYYNSPAFKLRLRNHTYPKYRSPITVDNSKGYYSSGGYWYNSGEDTSDPYLKGIDAILVDYSLKDNAEDGFPNRESILAHELGHYVDDLLSTQDGKYTYSESYPIFRKNRALRDVVEYGYPEMKKVARDNPNSLPDYYYGFHDALPAESYGDLMALRDMLYRAGIYDSRKANNPFTIKHLYQFKKINPNFRLFRYFNDKLIIQMMNEVAQVINQQNDYNMA